MAIIILSSLWLFGFILSYIMQRTEMDAGKETFTKGDRLLIISLSILSFIWVLVILITSWVKMVAVTGYWNRPVKKVAEEIKIKNAKTVAN